ncbi:MAG: hypothetical protein Kow006_12140 [Gammaproteobacteria bacterium]
MSDNAYSLARSARPFSLVVALVSSGLGLYLGMRETHAPLLLVVAVLVAGLLMQLGVNLINDKGDLESSPPVATGSRRQILFNYRMGIVSFCLAIGIGLVLVLFRGWPLLAIGVIGVLGAFAYTTEPFNYKRRALGVVLVFWLMGVLMVLGAYLSVTGRFSWTVVWHALPVSCLVSLLLLSNEIRDFERDREAGVRTLTVRIGLEAARNLYWVLLLLAFLLAAGVGVEIGLSRFPWLLMPLPLIVPIRRWLYADQRRPLPPWTGRFLLLFGVGYALAL